MDGEFDGTGALTQAWAGEDRRFRLGIAELREHDALLQQPPVQVARNLASGHGRFSDIRETIRLGLIGGGMARAQANALVQREINAAALWLVLPLAELAALILAAAVSGPALEAQEEPTGEGDRKPERLPFAMILGNGAAMGFTPEETGRMSLWEYQRAVDGVERSNGHEPEPPAPSEARFEQVMADSNG